MMTSNNRAVFETFIKPGEVLEVRRILKTSGKCPVWGNVAAKASARISVAGVIEVFHISVRDRAVHPTRALPRAFPDSFTGPQRGPADGFRCQER
jgi:regulator of RNase E activity RraA